MPTPSGSSNMSYITVDIPGVEKLLKNIKPNKAAGPNAIPCRIMKEAAHVLALVLADLFNTSLQSRKIPADWKLARVSPVFKKGNTNDASNYRPISLTCVCCKLLEHIISHEIRKHLDNHNISSKFQHGFRTGHSSESQLLTTIQDIIGSFNRGKQVDVAVQDFSKAFNVVPHQRVLSKLPHYGINGTAREWIADFLEGCSQQVVVDFSSGWSKVHSGLPQGTVLG